MRNMTDEQYRRYKNSLFEQILQNLHQPPLNIQSPIFISDGLRRRAELTFRFNKKQLVCGFNAAQSHNIVDIDNCLSLTPEINAILPLIKQFLNQFCTLPITIRIKNKVLTKQINNGEIWLTQAANGIDILLEIEETINLEQRMLISEFANNTQTVVRFSVGKKNSYPETILEKDRPYIDIGGYHVFIPAGTFLQASDAGQKALTDLVLQYVGDSNGQIADLFCGVGTFSYPLSQNIKNKIIAIDSSVELLNSFQQTVNAQIIPNITIQQRNLFKYPLDVRELKNFNIVIFDPPRAGASAQVKQIALLDSADKPQKIIAISCNPHTFVNDANTLADSGYILQTITLIDQFVYSKHFELAALFIKGESL